MRNSVLKPNSAVDLLIAFGTYSAWIILVLYGNEVPLIVLFLLGGYVTCLHGSLQHIAVHGYPTKFDWLNALLVYPPLALYFPYPTYRESHIAHHLCETLTDIETDPESLFVTAKHWNSMNKISKAIYRLNFTLLGRLLIGPFITLYQLWKGELKRIINGNTQCMLHWFLHIVGCAAIILFVTEVAAMPLWKYILCFAYPGVSLTLLRSYTEHRWSESETERSIIVEGSPLSRLLYLNNNFHWVHHENPQMPWRQVSKVFKERRDEILNLNGNFYYRSYLQIFSRLFKDKLIDPIHPHSSNP